MTNILSVRNLNCSFESQKPVLKNINFDFEPKKFYGLLGPSGCGKTTWIRILAGLEQNCTGVVKFGNTLWNEGSFCYPTAKRDVGFVFQNFALWPHMTVFENVSFPLEARGWDKEKIRTQCEKILSMTEILDFWNRKPGTLSGGQCQRVALARALVANPNLLLLDEPFSALDASLRDGLRGELRSLHKSWGGTSILVTHDWADVSSLCDQVVVIEAGEVLQIGTPQDLKTHPKSAYVRKLTT